MHVAIPTATSTTPMRMLPANNPMITGPYFSTRDTSWESLSVEVPSANADLAAPLFAIGRSSDLDFDSESLLLLESVLVADELEALEVVEESSVLEKLSSLERIDCSSVMEGARGSDFRLIARVVRKSVQASDWLVRGRSWMKLPSLGVVA